MSRIELQNHTMTDDQGRFELDQVPPGSLRISYREYTPAKHVRSWLNKSLEQVTLKPAQSLEVNIVQEGVNQKPGGLRSTRP